MTLQTNAATLKTIFSDVLAKLAFMFTDDEPIDVAPGQTWLETTISYHGPVHGGLRFRCTRDFAVLLAANLLGVDPEDNNASTQCEDAVKEFMNIVCGQLVTALHGSEDVYALSIPKTVDLAETPDLTDDGGVSSYTVTVDNHVIQMMYEPDVAGE